MIKIYTKTGDKGTTGLTGGGRVPKYHLRIEVVGTIDEVNSYFGLLQLPQKKLADEVLQIQKDLFVLGAQISSSKEPKLKIKQADVLRLEEGIDLAEKELAPLKNFILPGGSEASGQFHLIRTIVRRAERLAWKLQEELTQIQAILIAEEALIYLNRLSDLCFVWARLMNKIEGIEDILWIQN